MEFSRTNYPAVNWTAKHKPLSDIPERLKSFTGGTNRHSSLPSLVSQARLDGPKHICLSVWSAPGTTKPSFEDAIKQTFQPTQKGESFGPAWTNHWFKIELNIPTEWKDYERVQLEFDCSGEAMVFTTAGEIQHGLTGGFGRDRRVEFIIPPNIVKTGKVVYYLEASCNAMFGQATLENPDPNNVGQDILDTAAGEERFYRLNCAVLVAVDMDAQHLLWDFVTLRQLSESLPEDSSLARKAQHTANSIINLFRPDQPGSIIACRKLAERVLGEAWQAKDTKEKPNPKGRIWPIGHCHIDTAWLWPIEVTQQKSARSWSTQCDLMDRYPEHRFAATQAQQYKWVEQLYPGLFERIKVKVKEGRFQPVGCTWVEMDVNMPSGEALCRQFLYGQRFFEDRFGVRSHTCVLPDTFGYCAQLPQIIRLADAQDFFTIKLSWNEFNKFPHSTFNWVGLDGSQVLAHLSPTDSYSSQCDVEEFRQATAKHKNLGVTDQSIFLFGNGDGGGGPTPVMMEKLRRARAYGQLDDIGGLIAPVRMGGTFGEFFDSVREETSNGLTLPIWRGEMYFECHRGTYTTHAAIKRGNRKNEILIRQAEYASTMASLVDKSFAYPFKRLDAAWEDLLLCQFHDVLPGSGIAMIYDDAKRKYAAMDKDLNSVLQESFQVLYGPAKAIAKSTVHAVNTLPGQARLEVVSIPSTESLEAQRCSDSTTLVLVESAAKSTLATSIALPSASPPVSVKQIGSDEFVMANASLQVTIKAGRMVSIFDKHVKRELIPHGSSSGLVIMEDLPNNYDAWDIDTFHLEKQERVPFQDVKIFETGPLRVTLAAKVSLPSLKMDIKISLDAVNASTHVSSRPLIRFDAVVDWRTSHQILKFELPTTISAEEAIYDAQFGFVRRPTHRNTSHDAAKFEVCAHTFGDLSAFGYGVAIVNDCKYGYATVGNVMTLSLLRAPKSPDPDADMGVHEFSWAVYPHVNTFVESDVPQVAAAFNSPMIVYNAGVKPCFKNSPFSLSGTHNVVIDTVKRGEADRAGKGPKTVVLRLFERLGGYAKPALHISGFTVSRAELVNILEDAGEPLEIGTDSAGETTVTMEFRGFEIKTVKLYLKD